jgi:hypothetical protein
VKEEEEEEEERRRKKERIPFFNINHLFPTYRNIL